MREGRGGVRTYIRIGNVGWASKEIKDGFGDAGRPLYLRLIHNSRVENANGFDPMIHARDSIGLNASATLTGCCQAGRVDVGVLSLAAKLGDEVNGSLVWRDVRVQRIGDPVRVGGAIGGPVGDDEHAVGSHFG